MFMSLSIAAILPVIQAYGVFFTNTVSAILAWGGFGYVEIRPPLLSGRSYRNLMRLTLPQATMVHDTLWRSPAGCGGCWVLHGG